MLLIPIVLGFKALVVLYATLACVRARFAPGLWGLVIIAGFSVAVPLVVLTSTTAGALVEAVRSVPWAAPLVSTIAGLVATRIAFRTIDREPDPSPRVAPLEGAAYALLGSTILDAGLTVIGVLAAHLLGGAGS
ncbi:MAG: hypothetical protein M3Y87_32795 [Myxococcota bacterium]|nr:hypothetical protein [Myxococcota bacterium]